MIASVSVTGCQMEPSQRHWPITSPFTTRNHWSPSPAPAVVGSLIEYVAKLPAPPPSTMMSSIRAFAASSFCCKSVRDVSSSSARSGRMTSFNSWMSSRAASTFADTSRTESSPPSQRGQTMSPVSPRSFTPASPVLDCRSRLFMSATMSASIREGGAFKSLYCTTQSISSSSK